MIAPLQGDRPVAGTYAMRLVKGGPRVAVRIWHGAPVIDGEELDRSHDWRAEIDGRTDMIEKDDAGYRCTVALPVDKAWPWCAKEPIKDGEYRYLKALAEHARKHDPSHPAANPRKPVDLASMPGAF